MKTRNVRRKQWDRYFRVMLRSQPHGKVPWGLFRLDALDHRRRRYNERRRDG